MKKIFTLLLITVLCASCDDDDVAASVNTTFNFTHTWDNTVINDGNLNTVTVTNENGETIDFTRLRYLISRFELVDRNGTSFAFNGYKFTDLSNPSTYNFIPENATIPAGSYRLRFVWGFNEEDNIDGNYLDLNSASWNWPMMLGGGYHFLQLDGRYNINTTPSNYNFHNGTARSSTNPNVFEQNFVEIELPTPIEISNDANIEIVMNIAELFKNPHQWDLNVLDTPLMPNYTAQKMMQDNVETVFSLGNVSQ